MPAQEVGGDGIERVGRELVVALEHLPRVMGTRRKRSNLPRGFQRFGFENHFARGCSLRFRARVRFT